MQILRPKKINTVINLNFAVSRSYVIPAEHKDTPDYRGRDYTVVSLLTIFGNVRISSREC